MMLELRNVTKQFSGISAVDNVSFLARPGEVTGYLGPNGSGKSTTMKMITGLIERTFGHILFEGKLIDDDLIAFKRRMGYVPEEPYLYNHLSGAEYLTMVAQLRNLPARQSAEQIDGLLRLLALYDDRHASISGYSKGMRQKILIAAALLHNPALVLLDEPFSGLDVASALVLRSLIQELAARGKADGTAHARRHFFAARRGAGYRFGCATGGGPDRCVDWHGWCSAGWLPGCRLSSVCSAGNLCCASSISKRSRSTPT
jgi:ABC-2 type transport system ATP-binding protein